MRYYKKLNYLILFIYLFPLYTILYSQEKKENIHIYKSPKYQNVKFVNLEELHKIDLNVYVEYYIDKIISMDSDSNSNLYIVDRSKSSINIFDKNGKFIKTIGRAGQGPGDLEDVSWITIHNEKIYIYQNFKGMKVWDLQGKYIDYYRIPIGNYMIFKIANGYYYTIQFKGVDTPEKQHYILKKYNYNFTESKELFECIFLALIENGIRTLSNLSYNCNFAVDNNGNVYYPDNLDEYKINVFSADGNIINTFGRVYKRIPKSKTVMKILDETYYEPARKANFPLPKIKFSKYPPIIRQIMIDDKNSYIWVVVGEYSGDTFEKIKTETTIDIYSNIGEYLYTFKFPYISLVSFIKNGRLYSTPTEDDLYIRVFQIKYNK
jgi:hypothetical protein